MAMAMPEHQMDQRTDLDLILVGKTGNGKSATGNSILRKRKVFKNCYKTTSITQYPQYEATKFNGRIVQVVDCPGVLDTDVDKTKGKDLVKGAIRNAILTNPRGYHAFLVVVKFAHRFTKEEQDSIDILKDILGKDILKKYGIIVMSNGDTFRSECTENNISLEQFCKEQKGPFKQLIDECKNRIVVFDNLTKDEIVKKKQVEDLIVLVDQLETDCNRYTNKDFKEAEQIYFNLNSDPSEPAIVKYVFITMSIILEDLNSIKNVNESEEKIKILLDLNDTCIKLVYIIKEKEKRTDIFNKLVQTVEWTQENIKKRLHVLLNETEDNNKIRNLNQENVSQEIASASISDGCNKAEVKNLSLLVEAEKCDTAEGDVNKMTADKNKTHKNHQNSLNERKIENKITTSDTNNLDAELKQIEKQFREIKRDNDIIMFDRLIKYINTWYSTIKSRVLSFIKFNYT